MILMSLTKFEKMFTIQSSNLYQGKIHITHEMYILMTFHFKVAPKYFHPLKGNPIPIKQLLLSLLSPSPLQLLTTDLPILDIS